jgi:hypothetical protein
MKHETITFKEVHEHLRYDDGCIYWTKSGSGRVVGERAGYFQQSGYRYVTIKGVKYREHRIIFMMHHGYFPEHHVDHIDRTRANNKIDNLRHATTVCNSRNVGLRRNSTSLVTGVHNKTETRKKVRAVITLMEKQYHIGSFDRFEDAVMARWKAEVEHGYPTCNSTSPAYQYLLRHGLLTEEGQTC